ncbi:hypothetical protein SAY86_012798 [Trapa natans]|uniref:HMA domain-containing protein n=1 Tax=Trapa natans TaxID=22666 RepID=A0AAN7M0C0_TRANT|nr:hypothetical protein SAY86_012798 [Trapa natans]
MNKEEILKIQTCVLKVNIHCDGCKHEVKKTLQKIDGVFTTKIDSEQGKVTVSGTVDPLVLIKKLTKSGKNAQIWGSQQQKPNLNNQLKNLQIDPKNNKGGQKGNNHNNNHPPPKGGAQQQQQQQLPFTQQQLQQMKGFQDLKHTQFKDLKMMPGGFKGNPMPNLNQNQKKAVKLPPEEELMGEDEFDDEFDDDDYDSECDEGDFEDEMDDFHHCNTGRGNNKVVGSNVGMGGGPNAMLNALINGGGNYPQLMKGGSGGGGNNGKKDGSACGALPVHIGGGDAKNGGKKGNNQNQGGGGKSGGGKQGGSGGMETPNVKNSQSGGGGGGQACVQKGSSGGVGGGEQAGGKKGGSGVVVGGGGGSIGGMNVGGPYHSLDRTFQGHVSGGGIPMGGMPAIDGLPAPGGSGGQGYFGTQAGGNPNLQQQYMGAMMNQRAAAMAAAGGGGDPRFQPMMYARPPPAVNYMPPYPNPNPYTYPYPYPYPYPHPHPPHSDAYTHVFSDENTSSCSIM